MVCKITDIRISTKQCGEILFGHAMAQVVSCQPLTMEAQVHAQVIDTGTVFFSLKFFSFSLSVSFDPGSTC
jgi:hypothetical protein